MKWILIVIAVSDSSWVANTTRTVEGLTWEQCAAQQEVLADRGFLAVCKPDSSAAPEPTAGERG